MKGRGCQFDPLEKKLPSGLIRAKMAISLRFTDIISKP